MKVEKFKRIKKGEILKWTSILGDKCYGIVIDSNSNMCELLCLGEKPYFCTLTKRGFNSHYYTEMTVIKRYYKGYSETIAGFEAEVKMKNKHKKFFKEEYEKKITEIDTHINKIKNCINHLKS